MYTHYEFTSAVLCSTVLCSAGRGLGSPDSELKQTAGELNSEKGEVLLRGPALYETSVKTLRYVLTLTKTR